MKKCNVCIVESECEQRIISMSSSSVSFENIETLYGWYDTTFNSNCRSITVKCMSASNWDSCCYASRLSPPLMKWYALQIVIRLNIYPRVLHTYRPVRFGSVWIDWIEICKHFRNKISRCFDVCLDPTWYHSSWAIELIVWAAFVEQKACVRDHHLGSKSNRLEICQTK